ncbi:MAG TPA: zinc ABC transporter substrate-binding protein [Candidatus Hydrogenedentes bacterium]|nr:zinc ABC transporter substrate-binding protein [Candidatus Hydrogenedentota bacterium]
MHIIRKAVAMLVLAAASAVPAEALNVVTTTSDLGSIARDIGGRRVRVTPLQDGTHDPHFLQARPSYVVAARRADLWIRIGMSLEIGFEPVVLDSARNARIRPGARGHLDVSERVHRLGVPTGPIDRSMGDVHPEGNPHYWLDPLNGRIMAEHVAERMIELDPQGRSQYEAGLAAFKRKLDIAMFGEAAFDAFGGDELWRLQSDGQLDEALAGKGIQAGGWLAQMAPHRGKGVLMHHESWDYLLERFGLRIVGTLEPKPGIPPTGPHLAHIVELAGREDAKAIMVETFYSTRAADFVAARTNAKTVVIANAVGGQREATGYVEMITNVVKRLAAVLGGDA